MSKCSRWVVSSEGQVWGPPATRERVIGNIWEALEMFLKYLIFLGNQFKRSRVWTSWCSLVLLTSLLLDYNLGNSNTTQLYFWVTSWGQCVLFAFNSAEATFVLFWEQLYSQKAKTTSLKLLTAAALFFYLALNPADVFFNNPYLFKSVNLLKSSPSNSLLTRELQFI